MTRDSDFKALVRARMERTGQTYTQARADLRGPSPAPAGMPAPPPPVAGHVKDAPHQVEAPDRAEVRDQVEFERRARREQQRIVGRFFDGQALRSIPARRKVRVAVLLELVARFEPGRRYPEPEVNRILGRAHEDYAYLRRELVNYGSLHRADGNYWLAQTAPERDPLLRQEIPDWEAVWLPGHLAGSSPASSSADWRLMAAPSPDQSP